MNDLSREKRRALNIIWNAAGDYTVRSEFDAYDLRGKAELYWNFIIGAVHRYYDYPRLESFFQYLKQDSDHAFYEGLMWIGLENCAYQKGMVERPVLTDLRHNYALQVLRKEDTPSLYALVNEVKQAHFQKVLGKNAPMREQVVNLLKEIEFDSSMDTQQIILKMHEIIDEYFNFKSPRFTKDLLGLIFSSKNRLRIGSPFPWLFRTRWPSRVGPQIPLFGQGKQSPFSMQWHRMMDQWEHRQREYVQRFYGISILPDAQTKALEQMLCTSKHQDCHLHFTRGEFKSSDSDNMETAEHKKSLANQKEKNKEYFQANLARNRAKITKLTNIIQNSILFNLETSYYRAETGQFVAGQVWRNIHLNDRRIFMKKVTEEDIRNLTVDILLDASGSQVNRQEVLATQAYIIAESFTHCNIPVRMLSFSTSRSYNILNLFRDYNEPKNNERIFGYHSSGCNRDGLALRAIFHLLQKSPGEHKILIILSDVKPLDPHGVDRSQGQADDCFYADRVGILDMAQEVRKGQPYGVSVFCIFTGIDEDLTNAQKIFGHNLVRIKKLERFADALGMIMQNELKNL